MSERWSSLRIDDVPPITVAGELRWRPIRRTLGIEAFGINAYTGDKAGDDVVERHSEESLRHEEVYVVLAGRASFELDGESLDAPAGTIVFLRDPSVRRYAQAAEPGTTVLAIGGKPGEAYTPSAWEWYFEAERFREPLDTEAALRLMDEANERFPDHAGRRLLDRLLAGARRTRRGGARDAPPCRRARPAHARVGREATTTSRRSATGSDLTTRRPLGCRLRRPPSGRPGRSCGSRSAGAERRPSGICPAAGGDPSGRNPLGGFLLANEHQPPGVIR